MLVEPDSGLWMVTVSWPPPDPDPGSADSRMKSSELQRIIQLESTHHCSVTDSEGGCQAADITLECIGSSPV